MIKIHNKATNEFLGRISEAELAFLEKELEEEHAQDRDYYLRKETVDAFESRGATEHLLGLLRGGLRGEDAIEIRWERENSGS